MTDVSSRHVVYQLRWTEARRRLPGSVPVALFGDASRADADCRTRERGMRRGVNPFSFGGAALFHKSSLDAGRLHDWLLDHGIHHPPGVENWRLWCSEAYPNLEAAHQDAIWEALDKVRFFEVQEVSARSAFLVLEFAWKMGVGGGKAMPCDCEGGYVRHIHRTEKSAKQSLSRLAAELRERERGSIREWPAHGPYLVSRLSGKWPAGELSVEETPLAEIVQAPVMEEAPGATAYLVQRRAMEPEGGFCTDYNGDPTDGVVPLALYSTRESAESESARLESEARRVTSPFDFPGYHYTAYDITSRSYEAFRTEAQRLGLHPRGKKKNPWSGGQWDRYMPAHWAALWDKCVDELTDEQRAGVWRLLDLLRFHEVVEVRLDD